MKNLNDLSGLAIFVNIVEEGSLSAAGRAMNLPKSTISRQLSVLEKRLGVPLLIRSTRTLSLTDEGLHFYEKVQPIVREALDATAELINNQTIPSGTLHISAPVAYGQSEVAPRLIEFLKTYPDVRVDLHLTDNRVDLTDGKYDLAIRMGVIGDSDLVCTRIADVPMVIVASPGWLQQHGTPIKPHDLTRHPTIITHHDLAHWQIGDEIIRVSWRICTGHMQVSHQAARAGVGVARLPEFLVHDDIEAGKLIQLFKNYDILSTRVNALHSRNVEHKPALKAFISALTDGQS